MPKQMYFTIITTFTVSIFLYYSIGVVEATFICVMLLTMLIHLTYNGLGKELNRVLKELETIKKALKINHSKD